MPRPWRGVQWWTDRKPLAPLKVSAGMELGGTKWIRLYDAIVESQNRQGDGRPLLRLVIEVMKPVRFRSPEEFRSAQVDVNRALLHLGYQVADDGRVHKVKEAATVAEAHERADDLQAELQRRNVHPEVLALCRAELLQENYFHAVLEASKSLGHRLQRLTGVLDDGAKLVDQACSLSAPLVAFNALSTESEQSEHKGLAMLMKGVFSTFRNPTAHSPRVLWATSKEEAIDMMTLTSMLHRRLDKATVTKR